MSDNIRLELGTPEHMGRRFVDAWHRAESGDPREETHITFRDLETLLAALTPERLHLLRYVRHHEVSSVQAVGTELDRDYGNVLEDVEELTRLGLLSRTPERVLAPFAEVDARFAL